MKRSKIKSLTDINVGKGFVSSVRQEELDKDKKLIENGDMLSRNQAKLLEKELESKRLFEEQKSQLQHDELFEEFNEQIQLEDEENLEVNKLDFVVVIKNSKSNAELLQPNDVDKSMYDYVSPVKLRLPVDENNNPIDKFDFSYYYKQYELQKFKQETKTEFRDLENNDYKVVQNREPIDLKKLKDQYTALSLEDKIEVSKCRVVQKYFGKYESPELVEYNVYKKEDVQYFGIKTYPALINKYTKEVIMVYPGENPIDDFDKDFDLIEMSAKDKWVENPKTSLDDIRTRQDVKDFNFMIDYKDQNVEENTKMFNFVETEDKTDYQLRHIYFNEKYFLTEGEHDDNLDNYLDILLSQNLSKYTYDYIFRMFMKSKPHQWHRFGDKYFGLRLANWFNNQWIEYYTGIEDLEIIKKSDRMSPISNILINDGEESPKIERFKRRNQLIESKVVGGYLREITFESTDKIDEILEVMGEPAIYFEFDGINHYSFVLDGNYINDKMFEQANEVIKEFLQKTIGDEKLSNTKFDINDMYLSNFEKKYYENYKLTNNLFDFNILRR